MNMCLLYERHVDTIYTQQVGSARSSKGGDLRANTTPDMLLVQFELELLGTGRDSGLVLWPVEFR